ncbi:hypothetical protein [Bacillus marasmi]|uniref:hypothetical protein n=1 Tax=Bacillus marasmi TaxID=1926279 RepID=UPI00164E64F3|nr:hypothetical protein [Bacillus marasmi]
MKYPDTLIGLGLIILSVSLLLNLTLDVPAYITGIGMLIGMAIELYGLSLFKNHHKPR